jgi:hypothetical protein
VRIKEDMTLEASLRTKVDHTEQELSGYWESFEAHKKHDPAKRGKPDMSWKERVEASKARRKEREKRIKADEEGLARAREEYERLQVAKEPVDAIDYYLSEVHKNPDETDLLTGSLLLAEDRILSYAAVVRTKTRTYTAYEPRASFFFQVNIISLSHIHNTIHLVISSHTEWLYRLKPMRICYYHNVDDGSMVQWLVIFGYGIILGYYGNLTYIVTKSCY